MTKLEELRNQLKALTDKFTDAEDLKQVGAVCNTIDAIEAENKSAQENYQSLFDDYRQLVKSQSFKVDNNSMVDDGPKKEVNIEDFFKQK